MWPFMVGRDPVVQRRAKNNLSHWGAHEQGEEMTITFAFESKRD